MTIRSLAIAACAIALVACSSFALGDREVVRGNGTVRLQSREVSAFTGIRIAGSGFVRFSPGAVRQVTVESDTNILPLVETEVRGGVLVLQTEPGTSIRPTRLVFRITAPDLRSVTIAGSGGLRFETPLSTRRLDIGIEGSGGVEGKVDVEEVSVEILGSGGVALAGKADGARFEIGGSGSIDAADLAAVDARVVIQGSGSVTVQASRTLEVDIAGSGSVRYRGTAEVTLNRTGLGSLTEY